MLCGDCRQPVRLQVRKLRPSALPHQKAAPPFAVNPPHDILHHFSANCNEQTDQNVERSVKFLIKILKFSLESYFFHKKEK